MKVYSVADNIISPLGFTTEENFSAISNEETAIKEILPGKLSASSFHGALIENDSLINSIEDKVTRLEGMLILSISSALKKISKLNKDKTLLILSSTKGNIDLLNPQQNPDIPRERLRLGALANYLAGYFGLTCTPLVVSNACISGVSAILVGKKMINTGAYDHVIVAGGDILDEFVVSGFQSLMAISDKPCKPYDKSRDGVSLGEACGTMVLSNDPGLSNDRDSLALIAGGGQANDANHISGPSRTGEGLKLAISKALRQSQLEAKDVGYINAHGTATVYNDEMEAIAFDALGLNHVPLNSLKGFWGHTLGAAGVIESIMSIRQLTAGKLFKSLGLENKGVSKDIAVIEMNKELSCQIALKTASGFGGCNAAVIFEKI
ncbi:beta-ketoacyl synthase N-terminal-like domain-containing protein [Cytophagaceae bacterium ABcell3]|nr:beta-ketoacyl synthase N-terminal-like domain-containing protein [Cytophagaceae bacterium ABcell3]